MLLSAAAGVILAAGVYFWLRPNRARRIDVGRVSDAWRASNTLERGKGGDRV